MKKLLALVLALVLVCGVFTGCGLLEQVKSAVGLGDGANTGTNDHKHNFVLETEGTPTCGAPAKDLYKCECGETEERDGAAATGVHNFELTTKNVTLEDGTKKDLYTCSVCGAEEYREPGACEHDMELMKAGSPNCLKDATDIYKCTICGKMENRPGKPATGHNFVDMGEKKPTCTENGAYQSSCKNCGQKKDTPIPALGHQYDTNPVEASRLVPCTRKGCTHGLVQLENGKYAEVLVYTFDDSDKVEIEQKHSDVLAALESAENYDTEAHKFAETGELADDYAAFEALYEEYYDLVLFVVSQYQVAQIEYHLDMNSEEKEATFQFISEYRTELVSKFYSFSEPIYNSMYREFYYYGMTEAEIMAFIFDSNAVSNEEYVKLNDSNTAIELEFDNILDVAGSSKVPELYAQFVENNNKIAALLGYDNYVEYAYENVYGRDYSVSDVETIANFVKKYISSAYVGIDAKWNKLMSGEGLDMNAYYNEFYPMVAGSFFEDKNSNNLVNDYIDLLAFTSNPDHQVSFSDAFNALFTDGNLFRGQYQGAYVTAINGLPGMEHAVPIAYFGPGYDSGSTIVHEFGHYMNELYNIEGYSQSYDLLEMHSQGNEMLLLSFLANKLSPNGFDLVETYNMLNMTNTTLAALCVDAFERAVYTGEYEGTSSETIMADGKITSDEYDALYRSVLADFGVLGTNYVSSEYWRYMTIKSPCYYVSYSISAISVLQLYSKAQNEGFDAAKASYLKLFTYIDENPEMTTSDILKYAGLYSFTEEELYIQLSAALKKV